MLWFYHEIVDVIFIPFFACLEKPFNTLFVFMMVFSILLDNGCFKDRNEKMNDGVKNIRKINKIDDINNKKRWKKSKELLSLHMH